MTASRRSVLRRYGPTCWICLQHIDLTLPDADPMSFSRDHVIPRALGGTGHLANLRPAHRICNENRGHEYSNSATPGRSGLKIF